ncbi:MAG: prepilin-type N-terminal cleavage/methylation domain-containing protein [Candidatus Methanofishera endochildressiae]|uniref:Prepilin-type N-terminal cleavage/methylation domain-containing protein n=1 Tax=Candidatus Methanofishera endochildressiae TaxID=2738884 RepID=A0A7Z0MNU1_9GAMM|nr:prepilin-type N-terminal cleavage/methylation domain-containing protein [Candidatus Methanofishera endochildressiae]
MGNSYSFRRTKIKHKGFSLIELMVSMVVGLLVLAAVTGIFLAMLNSNNDNLKSMRLNQDLRAQEQSPKYETGVNLTGKSLTRLITTFKVLAFVIIRQLY